MAIEALQTSKQKLSQRRATLIYKVPESTLCNRIASRTPRSNTRPAVQNLTETKEQVIINYILDLDSRGVSPRQANVEDIANYLRKTRK